MYLNNYLYVKENKPQKNVYFIDFEFLSSQKKGFINVKEQKITHKNKTIYKILKIISKFMKLKLSLKVL